MLHLLKRPTLPNASDIADSSIAARKPRQMLSKLLPVKMGLLELETSSMMTNRLETNESQRRCHIYVRDVSVTLPTKSSRRIKHQTLVLNTPNEELRHEDWSFPTRDSNKSQRVSKQSLKQLHPTVIAKYTGFQNETCNIKSRKLALIAF